MKTMRGEEVGKIPQSEILDMSKPKSTKQISNETLLNLLILFED